MAGAFVVEAVGGGEAGPVGVGAATHQGGHAMPVQRPCLAEVHKVQHYLLTCTSEAEHQCCALSPPEVGTLMTTMLAQLTSCVMSCLTSL